MLSSMYLCFWFHMFSFYMLFILFVCTTVLFFFFVCSSCDPIAEADLHASFCCTIVSLPLLLSCVVGVDPGFYREDQRLRAESTGVLSGSFMNWHRQRKFHPSRKAPEICLLYTSPSPRDQRGSRMPSSA